MHNTSQNIQLHGNLYTANELKVLCDEKINNPDVQNWEKEIFMFLMDWFSSLDFITVRTSGSTGPSKNIVIQKSHMIASAKATLSYFELKKDNIAWLCLPVKYIAGKMMIVRSIVGGLNLVYSEPCSLPLISSTEKVDFTAMVPSQVIALSNTGEGLIQLFSINKLLIGGSSISKELERKLLENSKIRAWHSYGMTETITHIAIRRISPDNKSASYTPLPGVIISSNSDNQLIIDAPTIGVHKLITNDNVKNLDDGSFLLVGRSDNIIISGGVKLLPEAIERKIESIISNSFFVGGVPDEILGTKLVLFVEGSLVIDIEDLKIEMKKVLHKYEVPKEVICLPYFLRTETGKIIRGRIIDDFFNENL